MAGDLTTLANVKQYLFGSRTFEDDDALLQRLITKESKNFAAAIDRDLSVQSYTDIFDGRGQRRRGLREFPVVSVSSVSVDGYAIPQRPTVWASGVSYRPGWVVTSNGNNYTATSAGTSYNTAPSGTGTVSDGGVIWAWLSAAPAPTAAQDGWVLVRNEIQLQGYTFATNQPVGFGLLGFAFEQGVANCRIDYTAGYASIPADVEGVIIEVVAMRYREKDRLGVMSQSTHQGSSSFQTTSLPYSIQAVIKNYKRPSVG